MKIKKIDRTMPKERNVSAASLMNFRSCAFHHKTEERGGANNQMVGYMTEYEEFQDDLNSLEGMEE